MPTGPGDEILNAIEAGKADDAIMKQYSINGDQLKNFKSLYFGLSNQKMGYNEIGDLFPELNNYFKPGPAPKQTQQPVIEKPDFTKPVQEKLATESTALPSIKQSKAAADNAKDVESLQQKFDRGAKESLLTINKALAGHDDVVNNIIRHGRYSQAKEKAADQYDTEPKTDMPAAAQLALDRNRISPQETKPWEEPIAPEETAKLKEQIQGNESQARDFINKVVVNKPEEAKDLQHSMYLLDAVERMKKDPNIAIKVNNNLKEINNGNVKYNALKQQLTKDEGFFQSLVTGVGERTRQMQNYDLFQGKDEDVIKLLEKRRASFDPDAVVPVPTGMGEIGQMTGMEWKSLLKGFAVGAVTEPIGAEGAAPYITAAINSPEYYKRGYSTALEQSYDEFRKQGKSPEESLKLSQDQARTEGKLGAAEGFVSSFIGGRIGLKELPKFNVTGSFKNAVNGFLKSGAHGLGETTIEGLSDGLVAGMLQERKDAAAEEKGLFRDSEKNIKDNVEGEVTFAFAMAAMTKLGKGLISPDIYKRVKYFISKQDPKVVETKLGQMVVDGQISKEDADNINNEIKEQQAVDKTVPPDIKDVSRMAMIDKIKERDALEEDKKNTDKALHPGIQTKIDKLNDEILEHSKHIKSNDESETKAETQADAEADVKAEPGSAQETSQPEAAIDNKRGEGEAVPVADNNLQPQAEKISSPSSGALPEDIYVNLYNDYRQNLEEDERPLSYNEFKTRVDVDTLLEKEPSGSAKKKTLKDKNGKSFTAYFDSHGQDTYSVKVYDGKNKIGRLFLSKDKKSGKYYATGVDVDKNYQRNGIASEMYNMAEKEFNIKVQPSNVQSKEGKAFWSNRLNQQNATSEQSSAGVNVPQASRDNAQVGKGDESQGTVTEKTTGPQSEISAAKERFYETSIGASPSQHKGRITVDPIVSDKPGKRISRIIKDVSVGLKQRMLYTNPGKRAGGTYSPGSKGIKIRYNGDLAVTAHELGHSIDDHFDIYSKAKKNPAILQELNDYSNERLASTPSANHPNPQKYILQEGFAEWLRHYVVNPNEAERLAPNITALFKSSVNEDFQKVIKQFSNDVRTWAGSIGRDVELSNVEYDPSQKGTLAKLFKAEETNNEFSINWFDRLSANFLNPLNAFEKGFNYAKGIRGIDEVLPENDPIILSRILNGIDGKFGEILKSGMINGRGEVLRAEGGMMLYDKDGRLIKNSGTVKNLDWLLKPFDNKDEASIKRDMKDTIDYMIAERTIELSKKFDRGHLLTGLGGGILSDFSVAQKTLNRLENGDPERLARIQEATNRYREFADDTLRYAVDKGRMSQEQYDLIKENNVQYVAMQRILENGPGEELIVFQPKGGNKLGGKTEIIHTIKGSTKEIVNPYIPLLDTLYKTIRESDRNEVLQAFRKMLKDKRGMNEGKPKRLSDIGVRVSDDTKGAIPIFIDGVPEKWMFQNDIHSQLLNLNKDAYKVHKLLSGPAQALRFFTVHYPSFAVRNWVKDLQDRVIKSTTGSGVSDLYGNPEDWHAIARYGGLNSGLYLKNKNAYYGLLTEAMSVISKDKKFIIANPDLLKHAWHKYEDLLYKGETSNRVAEYRSALRKAQNEGLDNYNASLYAAFKSRDLIDFAIMGHWMKVINQIIPFSNAAIQGLRSAAVSFRNNPWGFIGRTALYSIIPGMAAWWWNHRNDEDVKLYEELPAYQRDMFWNFRIAPNQWLSVPKPYELALPQAGIDRLLSYKYAGNEKAFDGYGNDIKKLLLPFDEGNLAGPYQGIYEGISNYDFFREHTIIPPDEDPLDLALRHTETATRLGQLLQNLSGWDGRKWDHLIQRQFSYTGNFTLKLSDIGRDKSRHEFDLSDTGIFKRSPAYNSKSVQDMIQFAKSFNLTKTPPYKNFNQIVGKYFNADTDQEREDIGKELIDYSKQLLDEWKARKTDETQKIKADAKKAAQNR